MVHACVYLKGARVRARSDFLSTILLSKAKSLRLYLTVIKLPSCIMLIKVKNNECLSVICNPKLVTFVLQVYLYN